MSVSEKLRRPLRWIGRHELGVLLSVLALASGVLAFGTVASELGEGDVEAFDRAVLLSLRTQGRVNDPVGPRWLEEMGRDLTALGGVGVLTLITVSVVGYLLLLRRVRSALFVAVSITGASLLVGPLKELFGRARPALVPHLSIAESSSFPSGHSMLAAAVYLTLGALLARMESRLVVKAYILGWALLLALLVGVSRVYVGVHWPTDVLAGWAAGAAWAAMSWLVARALQRRGRIEQTPQDQSAES